MFKLFKFVGKEIKCGYQERDSLATVNRTIQEEASNVRRVASIYDLSHKSSSCRKLVFDVDILLYRSDSSFE